MRIFMIKALLLFSMLSAKILWAHVPIIPLDNKFSREVFLNEGLRDPVLWKASAIKDEIGFQQATEELRSNIAELAKAKGSRKADLLEQIYLSYQSISYFFLDIKMRRTHLANTPKNIDSKINEVRKAAQTYASQYIRLAYNKKKKARAIYHYLANRYLMTAIKGQSVKELKTIKSNLNAYLKRRVNFLEGIYLTEYKNSSQGVEILKKTLPTMPLLPAVGARIVIARHLAGLNYKGIRFKKTDQGYKAFTQVVGDKVRNLNSYEKSLILNHLIVIWRGASGRRGTWTQVPFRLTYFRKQTQSLAIVERAALEQLSRKNTQLSGIRKYEAIAKDSSNLAFNKDIDLRIIQLYEKRYRVFDDINKMQSIYQSYEKKYQSHDKMLATIRARHLRTIKKIIAQAKNRRSTKSLRTVAITSVYRFLPGSSLDKEKIFLESEIGKIYELNQQFGKAAQIYISLKQRSQGSESFNYLLKAIKNQSIIAQWPQKAPWQGMTKNKSQPRKTLVTLMKEKFDRTHTWSDLAHVGLLLVNLRRGNEALTLFHDQLEKQPKGFHASHAAGLLALTYLNAKQWDDLEKTARFLLTTDLQPIHRGKKYSSYSLLSDALFFGGKDYYNKKLWVKSATKLEEFTLQFKADKRRPEGLFLLGLAQHNGGQHPQSIKTYLNLATEYSGSNFEKQVLLLGGKWSIPMAYEDQTIFFYQRFVNRYNNHPEAIATRATLKDLYLGRELYGDATRIMQRDVEDYRLPIFDRVNSALAVIDTEERYGEIKHAKWGVRQVKKLAFDNASALAKVLAFETRVAARNKDFQKLKRLEHEFAKLPSKSRDAIEGLAQVRFILANHTVKDTKNKFYNLELPDPNSILDRQLALFKQMKKTFDRVCEVGTSSYCAPAMIQLAEATKYTLDAIDDVSVPQTLDQGTVDSFENKKYDLVSYIDDVANRAFETALGLTEDGQNTPEWSRQILWNTDNDWSYQQANSNAGSSFVQWRALQEPIVKSRFSFDLGDTEW